MRFSIVKRVNLSPLTWRDNFGKTEVWLGNKWHSWDNMILLKVTVNPSLPLIPGKIFWISIDVREKIIIWKL